MSSRSGFLERHGVRMVGLLIVVALYGFTRLPALDSDERRELAARFGFEESRLPEPPDGPAPRQIRNVHPSLKEMAAWVSAVGASVALNDLDGDGLPNDVCHIDTRIDRVIVAPAPGTPERYAPFFLNPRPRPYDDSTMAPMGCVPGDLNEDGYTDMLVYYWGRTPLAFLRSGQDSRAAVAGTLGPDSFVPAEILDSTQRWFTNAATFADVDGDGHIDLVVGNYFEDDARILDAEDGSQERQHMQASFSRAANGGTNRLFLWEGGRSGERPEVRYREVPGVLTGFARDGWTLAIGAADLDGDQRPELYFANDFGPDQLLHNLSKPHEPGFRALRGRKTLTTPNSKVLGRDSFKGMGVDFADVNNDGILDIYVSNIANEWALEESHFVWVSNGSGKMEDGVAPYADRSEPLGLSRSGWGWDTRFGDFDNDGTVEALQATGFVKGTTDRWPELHETAMGNDTLINNPASWPRFKQGDDLSGGLSNPFFVRSSSGRYYDLAPDLGIDQPQVTRGIATADVDADGRLDFAVANQWAASRFYRNVGSSPDAFLGLSLRLPVGPDAEGRADREWDGLLPAPGTRAAIGAAATVTRTDGRVLVGQVDGGNGHSGARSPELHFGLGSERKAVQVDLKWRDGQGQAHSRRIFLKPGWHTLVLADSRKEGTDESR